MKLNRVHANIRHIFNNTELINDKYIKVKACVIVEDNLLKEMDRFVKASNYLVRKDYVASNVTLPIYKPLMNISSVTSF